MRSLLCPCDGALAGHSRVAIGAHSEAGIRGWEFGLLLATGVGAMVLSDAIEFKLRLPGHAIVRAIPPLALGLALVPRRGGGSITAFGADIGALALRGFGWQTGLGAVASAVFFGPMVDLLIRWARNGWELYVAFGLAGLFTNIVAFGYGTKRRVATWVRIPIASTWASTCGRMCAIMGTWCSCVPSRARRCLNGPRRS